MGKCNTTKNYLFTQLKKKRKKELTMTISKRTIIEKVWNAHMCGPNSSDTMAHTHN